MRTRPTTSWTISKQPLPTSALLSLCAVDALPLAITVDLPLYSHTGILRHLHFLSPISHAASSLTRCPACTCLVVSSIWCSDCAAQSVCGVLYLQEETISLAHPGRHNPMPRVRGKPADQAAYPQLEKADSDRGALLLQRALPVLPESCHVLISKHLRCDA